MCVCEKAMPPTKCLSLQNPKPEKEALLMSTHNICFCREIRKLFTWYPLLSRPMDTLSAYHICPKIWNSLFYFILMCLNCCCMYGKQCRPCIVHILSPETDNCSSWISRMERNDHRKYFMIKSPRKNIANQWGFNPQFSDHQSDAHPTESPRPAHIFVNYQQYNSIETKVGRQIPPPVFTSGICRHLPVWKILLKWQILANTGKLKFFLALKNCRSL